MLHTIIRLACPAGKLEKQTAALHSERQQHCDTQRALSEQTAAAATLLEERSQRCTYFNTVMQHAKDTTS